MHTRWLIAIGGLVATLALASALATGLAPAARAEQTRLVRVGISNTVADVGNYVADKRGYFAAEGLSVKLIPFDAAAMMIAPLASGELDAGGGGVAAGLFNAVGRGVSLKIVGDKSSSPRGMATGALMLRSELITSGRYRSLADMRGWTLALPAQATATSATLDRYLATAGMSLKEMHLVYLSFPAMVSALQNAAVEGAFMVEPGITRVEDLGVARWIAGDDEMSPGHEIAVSLNSEQFLRNDRDSALRYMRALLRGIRDYTDTVEAGHLHGPGAEAMIAILTEYSLIKDAALYRRIRMPATDPDGRLNIASLEADLAYFRAQGLIKGDVQVADVVDSSLAEQAVRALGPYRRTQ